MTAIPEKWPPQLQSLITCQMLPKAISTSPHTPAYVTPSRAALENSDWEPIKLSPGTQCGHRDQTEL